MKKLSLILVAALAIGATSCQDETSNAKPTVNPQLPIMTENDLVVETNVAPSIDLTAFNETATPIPFADVKVCQNVPEDYELEFVATLSRDEEFTRTADFNLTMTDGQLVAAPDALEAAYVAALGKSAKPKDVWFRVAAFAVNGTSRVQIGNPEYYICSGTTNITPLDLGIVIENGYGLLGTINGWSVANAVPFHNNGQSGYDDPIFKLTVYISVAEAEAGWWWKVVPQSTIDNGDWMDVANSSFGPAVNGDDALEGNLIPRSETQDSQAGCVKVPGVYVLTIDMENQSYEFVPQFDYLWACGDPSWTHATAPMIPGSVGGTKFMGYAQLSGSFKLTDQPNWLGVNYGLGDAAGKLSIDGGAKNLSVAKKAMYFVLADIEALTYSTTEITSCGLIGDFNSWAAQEPLTSTDGGLTWTGKLSVTEGQGWKIRFNDNWDINLGGDLNNLTVNGDNITVPAGTYDVKLDISKLPYNITLN